MTKLIRSSDLQEFRARMEQYLKFAGQKSEYCWILKTRYGLYRVNHFHDDDNHILASVFGRFDEPARAKETHCNPYTGKLNFHYSREDFRNLGVNGVVREITNRLDRLCEFCEINPIMTVRKHKGVPKNALPSRR